jgi:hypothetical protein
MFKSARILLLSVLAMLILASGKAYAQGPTIEGQWVMAHWCNDNIDVSPVIYSPSGSYWYVPSPNYNPRTGQTTYYDIPVVIGSYVLIHGVGIWNSPDDRLCTAEYGTIPGFNTSVPSGTWAETLQPSVSFTVDQTTLGPGQCTTLRWNVDYVQAVYLDGQPESGHQTKQVCPLSTTTYTLRVSTNNGEIDQKATVNVVGASTAGLVVVGGLSLSSPNLVNPFQQVNANFRLHNGSSQPIFIVQLVAGSRGSDAWRLNWSAPNVDFRAETNILIQPGQDYIYSESQEFKTPGEYFTEPSMLDLNGQWGGIPPYPRVPFIVRDSNSPPVPVPVPAPAYDPEVQRRLAEIFSPDAIAKFSDEISQAKDEGTCAFDLYYAGKSYVLSGFTAIVIPPDMPDACSMALVDIENQIESALAHLPIPTLAPTPISGSPVPIPVPPPAPTNPSQPNITSGVYVTSIQLQTPDAKRNQGVPFVITFLNTTSGTQNYDILVQVFDADTNKGFGETAVLPSGIPMGTSTLVSPDNWAVKGPGGCVPFVARAYFQNSDNSRTAFQNTDGTTPQLNFTVCP